MNQSRINPLACFGIALVMFFVVAHYAHAATITVDRATVTARPGDTVRLTYTLNPQGEPNYTVKMNLVFPPSLLQLQSFEYGSGWIALPQPGYDEIDNVQGTLIKTGGYARGVANPTAFGTAVFTVRGSGTGTVTVAQDSFVLNARDADVLTAPRAVTTITASASATAQPALPDAPILAFQRALFDVTVVPSGEARTGVLVWMIVIPIALLFAYLLYERWHRRRIRQRLWEEMLRNAESSSEL